MKKIQIKKEKIMQYIFYIMCSLTIIFMIMFVQVEHEVLWMGDGVFYTLTEGWMLE